MNKQDKVYVINTAIEGGINYWAGVKNYDPDRGTCILVVQNDETEHAGKEFEISPATVTKGLQVLKSKESKEYASIYARIIGEDYDAWDADSLVQAAIFGEIIFG